MNRATTGQLDFLASRPRCADRPPDESIGNSTERENSKVLRFYKSDRLIANPQTIKAAKLDQITCLRHYFGRQVWANLACLCGRTAPVCVETRTGRRRQEDIGYGK